MILPRTSGGQGNGDPQSIRLKEASGAKEGRGSDFGVVQIASTTILPKMLQLTVILVSFSLFGLWVIWRIRAHRAAGRGLRTQYGLAQILGILGILFVLVPVFLVTIATVLELLSGAALYILSLLPVPSAAQAVASWIFGTIGLVLCLIGTYLLCEMIWPRTSLPAE